MDGGEEVDGSSIVAGGDAAVMLLAADQALDLVARAIACLVVAGWMLARGVGRDHRLGAHVDDGLAQVPGIVGLVSQDITGGLARQ